VCAGRQRVELRVFYLGGINDSQEGAWLQRTGVFNVQVQPQTEPALYASRQPFPPQFSAAAPPIGTGVNERPSDGVFSVVLSEHFDAIGLGATDGDKTLTTSGLRRCGGALKRTG